MAEHKMKTIRIEKVTLNIGCGTDQKKLEKAIKLLKHITGVDPVRAKTKKRIAGWGLRPGLPIGAKITLRGQRAQEVFDRCLVARDKRLKPSMFDNNGNISFGVKEYIDIPGTQYDPEIGIIGLQVTATLSRPGFRIKLRKVKPTKIPMKHRISKDEAIAFAAEKFEAKVE